jgi:hypothetical protein
MRSTTHPRYRMMVVEGQERIRRVAAKGLLSSNIGNDWGTSMLRAKLLGRWVKVSGWLFYDADHHLESWWVDKHNTRDGNNWRATGWEIHPVMALKRACNRHCMRNRQAHRQVHPAAMV